MLICVIIHVYMGDLSLYWGLKLGDIELEETKRTRPTLAALELFVQVVDEGSKSKVAKERGRTYNAVEAQIHSLETRYGTLLERRGHSFVPTPAGEYLAEQARRILHMVDALAPLKEGHLLIAASRTVGGFYLPQLVAAFQSEHPDLRIEVSIDDSKEVEESVRRRRADIGFVGKIPGADLASDTVFGDDIVPIVAGVNSQHGLHWLHERYPQGLNLEEFVTLVNEEKVRLVIRGSGSATREESIRYLEQMGCNPEVLERNAVGWGSNAAVKGLVQATDYVGLVSRRAIALEINTNLLTELMLNGWECTRDHYMIYRTDAGIPTLVNEFIEFVNDHPGAR